MTAAYRLLQRQRADSINFNRLARDRWVASVARRLPEGTRLLDVGAGTCRYRSLCRHCTSTAPDVAQYTGQHMGVTRQVWHYGQLDCVSDAASIPVEDSCFDAVLCTEVLEHVPEPIKVLHEIARILRPGGQAFISAPLGSGLHQQPYHFYGGFTPYFYRHFLDTVGLEVQTIMPNGRFFRLLLQEINRGVVIAIAHRPYPIYHPLRWLLRALVSYPVVRWLNHLDDTLPVDEFTVGYHVEALKRAG